MELWKSSTWSSLQVASDYSGLVSVLVYDDLVSRTRDAMQHLCDRIDVDYVESLTVPTFRGVPVLSNSSYEIAEHGVQDKSLMRWKQVLTDHEKRHIEAEAVPLYQSVIRNFGLSSTVR